MVADRFDAVLFDLGGVLLRMGGVNAMQRLAGIDSEAEIWRRWLSCAWVRRFERGWCSADDFAAGVVADWGMSVTPSEFLDHFRSWPEGPYRGAEALVQLVGSRVRVGCVSNTNALHWEEHARRWRLTEWFEMRFLSHELGLIKPDRELFEHVADMVAVPAARVAFLDDNAMNIAEARSVGFTAVQVRGVHETRSALVDLGVL